MSIIKNFIIIIFFATFISQVNAEEVKKMGTHKDWETYVINSDTGKVCFAQSKPVLQSPKANPREARLFISFRPGEKITNEISVTAGYEFNNKNSVIAQSGKNKYKLDLKKSGSHHDLTNQDVNDDEELVKKYADSVKNIWNGLHDIEIGGYEVEVYIQGIKEIHKASGIYSVMNDEWNVKPSKKDFEPNEELIKEKAKSAMMMVDDLEGDIDEDKYEEFQKKVKKVWDKIKNYRKSGLATQGGEFSTGNLVFKLLRRNGYIGKVLVLKRKSYDNQFN